MSKKGRIEREKETIELMVRLYCKRKLRLREVPLEYEELIRYAHHRLDHCRHGEHKPTCKRCKIHCYGREKRQEIREIMRWCGPRMLIYAPIAAVRHMLGW